MRYTPLRVTPYVITIYTLVNRPLEIFASDPAEPARPAVKPIMALWVQRSAFCSVAFIPCPALGGAAVDVAINQSHVTNNIRLHSHVVPHIPQKLIRLLWFTHFTIC